MTTKSQAFDHPAYEVRMSANMPEAGGAAATQYSKFCAFTTLQLYSATLTVTTSGTATTNTLVAQYITSTSTTALGTASFGVATIATTSNILLGTQATGGYALPAGGLVVILSGTDATGKVAVSYEYSIAPLSNITA